jgi:hypothetical protein
VRIGPKVYGVWDFILGTIAAVVTAALVAPIFVALMRRRTRRSIEAGRPEFIAAIRLRDSGGAKPGWWRGRWRHGHLTITPVGAWWHPTFLRPGPPIDLPRPVVGEQRKVRWFEQWWIDGNLRVLELTAGGRRYDVAIPLEAVSLIKRIPSGSAS